jgi:hypothetical protein
MDGKQLAKEICCLKSRFIRSPADKRLEKHADKDGNVSACCQSALASLRGSIVTAGLQGGVCGVVELCTRKFGWGCYPAKYYCECMQHSKELYCTATMLIHLECLQRFKELDSGNSQIGLLAVEVISVLSQESVEYVHRVIGAATKKHGDRMIHDGWVMDHTDYHQLAGVVDCEGRLTLCDCDGRVLVRPTDESCEARIVCIRATPWSGGGDTLSANGRRQVAWCGMDVPLGRWATVPANTATSQTVSNTQLALQQLSRVYQDATSNTVDEGSSKKHHVDALSTPGPASKVPRTSPSIDSFAESTDSPDTDASVSNIASNRADPQPLTVYISGVYMGTNPCPGVGVARALRVHYNATPSAALRLVAVDSCDTSDRVFDGFIQLVAEGAEVEAQVLWQTVQKRVQEQRDAGRASFYIPVRGSIGTVTFRTVYINGV